MKDYELRRSEVIVVINRKQEIIFCSEDSLELLGYLPSELEGKLITILINDRQKRVQQAHIDNFTENGKEPRV